MSCSVIDQIYLILKLQGWSADPNWGQRRKLAHGLYGVVTFGVMVASLGIHLDRLPKQIRNEDSESLFFTLFVFSSYLVVNCYVLILIFLEPKMRDFQKELQGTEKIVFKHAPIAAIKQYQQDCHRSLTGLRLFMFLCLANSTGWALTPIMPLMSHPLINYEKSRTVLTDFDYGLNKTACFWYIYAFESVELFQLVIDYAIGYAVAISLYVLVKAQFSLLIRSIESAHGVFLREIGGRDKKSITQLKLRNYVLHHQHALRLMNKTKSILKPIFFIDVFHNVIVLANLVVITTMEGPALRKIVAVTTTIILLNYFAVLLWFLSDLRATCLRVGFLFYSLALSVDEPSLRKECLLTVLRSNHPQKFPCFVTSSLTFSFLYKALDMIWNYSSFSQSMTSKPA